MAATLVRADAMSALLALTSPLNTSFGSIAMTDESELAPLRVSDLCGDQVTDEIRTKIGELVNRWAYVEYQLKVIIRVPP
jgi:hypothetical protein